MRCFEEGRLQLGFRGSFLCGICKTNSADIIEVGALPSNVARRYVCGECASLAPGPGPILPEAVSCFLLATATFDPIVDASAGPILNDAQAAVAIAALESTRDVHTARVAELRTAVEALMNTPASSRVSGDNDPAVNTLTGAEDDEFTDGIEPVDDDVGSYPHGAAGVAAAGVRQGYSLAARLVEAEENLRQRRHTMHNTSGWVQDFSAQARRQPRRRSAQRRRRSSRSVRTRSIPDGSDGGLGLHILRLSK